MKRAVQEAQAEFLTSTWLNDLAGNIFQGDDTTNGEVKVILDKCTDFDRIKYSIAFEHSNGRELCGRLIPLLGTDEIVDDYFLYVLQHDLWLSEAGAKNKLGVMYFQWQDWVQQDVEKGLRYLEEASKEWSFVASDTLAFIYLSGMEWIQEDFAKSNKYNELRKKQQEEQGE